MLTQRLEPVDSPYHGRASVGGATYQRMLKARGRSIHERFVERALNVFAGAWVVQEIGPIQKRGEKRCG